MAAHRYWRIYQYTAPAYGYSVMDEVELRASKGGADETGSGTATASSTLYGSGYNPPNLVDNNLGTFWHSGVNYAPHWWKYDFGEGEAKDIVEIYIDPHDANQAPIYFSLDYSDDDSVWVVSFKWRNTWADTTPKVFNDENQIIFQEVFNVVGQAEYEANAMQKFFNVVGQAEYGTINRLEVRWLFAQAEYDDTPLPSTGGGLFFGHG
jgi:hypothetical protein